MGLLVLCVNAQGSRGISEGTVYTVEREVACPCGKNSGGYELAETPPYPGGPRRKHCRFCHRPEIFSRCSYVRRRFIRLNDPSADLRETEKEKELS